jgi:hypothetical protein
VSSNLTDLNYIVIFFFFTKKKYYKISGHTLMVKHAVFQTENIGSNPIGRNFTYIEYNVMFFGVSNLIGKGLSCHESRCRIEAGLTR